MELTARPSLPASVAVPSAKGAAVSVVFSPPLTEAQKTQLAGQPLTVVASTPDGKLTLTTPNGQTVTAQVGGAQPSPAGGAVANAPLPVGVPVGAVVTMLAGGGARGADAAVRVVRLPADVRHAATAQPLAQSMAETAAPKGAGTPLPVVLPSRAMVGAQAFARVADAVQVLLPGQTQVPAGPVAVKWTQPLTPAQQTALAQQPAVATVTGPSPDKTLGPQAFQATLAIPGTSVQVPLAATVGVPLPKGTVLPMVILQPVEEPGTPPQPTALLTQPVTVPLKGIQTPPASIPNTPLTVVLTPQAGKPLPIGVFTARVLPAPAGPEGDQPPQTQPILLANGLRGVVQSAVPIPEGSVLMVEIPSLTSAPSVVQVVPSGGQNNQPQGAVPGTTSVAALQTAAPVLPAGAVVEGLITGQNAQGQLELTLTEPPTLQGQTVALSVTQGPQGQPENAPQLPVMTEGTRLQVQVQADGTAKVLTLTLPPSAEKANTVSTLGQQWAALTRVLDSLQQQAPGQAAALQARLPQVDNLLPNLMHVMRAIQTGNPADMVGAQLANLLRASSPDVVRDLQSLTPLQNKVENTTTGASSPTDAATWRGTLFPYVEGPLDKDPKQGRFFWRREQSDDPRSKSPTRFVMEMTLSNTGPLQLDGLVQYPGMWLKLRRTIPAEPGFTEGLQQLVAGLLEAYGMNGGVTVDVTPTFPVNPTRDILAATPEPLAVKA